MQAIEELEMKYGYKRYPYKHYESIFTRFYQGYILPEKFEIDKRKLHFSSLISSDQLNRGVAIRDLCNIPYPSLSDLESDKKYFLKKMNWSENDLISYLKRESIKHDFYPSEKKLWDTLYKIKSKLS